MVARRFPLVAVALFAMAIVNTNVILAEKPSRPDSGLPLAEPADLGLAAEPLAEITSRMRKKVDEHRAAGVVSLVAYKGKVVHFSAVGQADVEGNRPMSKDSMFAIASMTKPITGAALMILVDEGKLSLDDPVAKYVPEFKNATVGDKPLARDVTLRDLATHTSGLGGEQRNEGTLAETAVMLAHRPLSFQPGEKWQY
ncbi:MAG: serine hydrolase, partial [Planctomycetales bacterium]|nr:serine hydrolase [Planctomycetales bacterium]